MPASARHGFSPEQSRTLDSALAELRAELRAELTAPDRVVDRRGAGVTTPIRPRPGDVVRAVAGDVVVLPHPRAAKGREPVVVLAESTPVDVLADAGTVNDTTRVTITATGGQSWWSTGTEWWGSAVGGSGGSGGNLTAEYVVGAADATLPNARVATDSTEVDAVLTTPNVISWVLNAASVAFAKLANLTGLSVLGRAATSTGVMAAITATAGSDAVLRESGSTLGFGTVATAGIANNAVTDAKLRDSAGLSVIGRSVNSSGDPADITATAARQALMSNSAGTAIGWRTPQYADLETVAGLSVMARAVNSVGVVAPLTTGVSGNDGKAVVLDEASSTLVWARPKILIHENVTTLHGLANDLDFIDSSSVLWSLSLAGSRVQITPTVTGMAPAGEPFVTYSASGNLSAERVTTSSTSVTVSTSVANQIEFQRAALTGDVTASANSNTTAIAAGVIVNADVNASAAIALSKLATQADNTVVANLSGGVAVPTALALSTFVAAIDSTSIASSGNTLVREALTGDVTAGTNSNVTAIAAGVIVNADVNASAAIDLSKLATQAANTIVANATGSTAVPTAVALDDNELLARQGTANLAALEVSTGTAVANIQEGSTSTGLGAQDRDEMIRWLESTANVTVFEREFQGNLAALGAEFTSRPSTAGTSTVTISLSNIDDPGWLGALVFSMSHSTVASGSAWVLGADENALNFNWGSFRYLAAIVRPGSSAATVRTAFAIGLLGQFAGYGAASSKGLLGSTTNGVWWAFDTGTDSGQWCAGIRTGSANGSTASGTVATDDRYLLEIFKAADGTLYYYLNGSLVRSDGADSIADGPCTFYLASRAETNTGARAYQLDYLKIVSQPPNRFGN